MVRDLSAEKLTALPKRYETLFFLRSFNTNAAAVYQENTSVQIMGIGIAAAQYNSQANVATVVQTN